MKPFDLELAKAGHPLVTRDGRKVMEFHCIESLMNSSFPCRAVIEQDPLGHCNAYPISGAYNIHCISPSDLFLDDSVEWEKPLKIGDEVECLVNGHWLPRIFVAELECGGCLHVRVADNSDFETKSGFTSFFKPKGEWRRKVLVKAPVITVEYDGEKVELSKELKERIEQEISTREVAKPVKIDQ